MKAVYRWIGAVVFWRWLLGVVHLIDFRLCVGPAGSCYADQPARPTRGTI